MSAQHTPGPWIGAGPSFGDPLPRYINEIVTVEEDEYGGVETICRLPFNTYDAENEANALLIAAAPDMLAALLLLTQADPCIAQTTDDELRAAMEDMSEEQEVRDQARAFLAARAAIAKATGGQP